MKRSGRILLITALALGLAPFLEGIGAGAATDAAPILVMIRGVPAFDRTREGFLSRLPQTTVIELAPDMSDARAAIEPVQQLHPAVVVALGSAAAMAVEQYLPGMPTVLGLILQPKLLGPGQATRCGFTLTIDPETRLAALDRLFAPLKKLGVLSGPDGSDEVDLLARAAQARGMGIQLLKVRRPEEIATALRSLDGSVQVLLLTTEPLFLKEEVSRALILKTMEARVPVVGFSEKTVRIGGLAALEVDYRRHGDELARQAGAVMDGQTAGKCGFKPVEQYLWVLNQQTARTLGLSIPRDVLENSTSVGGGGRP